MPRGAQRKDIVSIQPLGPRLACIARALVCRNGSEPFMKQVHMNANFWHNCLFSFHISYLTWLHKHDNANTHVRILIYTRAYIASRKPHARALATHCRFAHGRDEAIDQVSTSCFAHRNSGKISYLIYEICWTKMSYKNYKIPMNIRSYKNYKNDAQSTKFETNSYEVCE